MKNLQGRVLKSPQNLQQDVLAGIHKGIVVDVRDPTSSGKVRVHLYGLQGDYANLDVYSIPWAEMAKSIRGSFGPPQLWDRVLVSFEVGDSKAPLVVGYWTANPAGKGSLPYSKRVGSEIRPEGWHNRDLYPEAIILGASGLGNAIWMLDKVISGTDVASVIQMEDTGGKEIKIRSYHPGKQPFLTKDQVPEGKGALLGGFGEPGKPLRDGFSTVTDPVAGSIELNQQNTSRIMQSSTTNFATDIMIQTGGISQISAGGKFHNLQQGLASVTLFNDSFSLMGKKGAVFTEQVLPRRWD